MNKEVNKENRKQKKLLYKEFFLKINYTVSLKNIKFIKKMYILAALFVLYL